MEVNPFGRIASSSRDVVVGASPMIHDTFVHIIDDDPSIRRTLEKLFASVGTPARSYASAQDFLDAGEDRVNSSECLVLDVRMPGIGGLDFQAHLASSGRTLPVIMMTGHADIAMSVRAMKAGAVDFLAKPFREQDMLEAVTEALAVDRNNRKLLAEVEQIRARYQSLSRRETQVMRLVTVGRLNKQIAGELDISSITVKIYRAAVMRKMEAKTLTDLVRMAAVLCLHQAEHGSIVALGSAEAVAATIAVRSVRAPARLRSVA